MVVAVAEASPHDVAEVQAAGEVANAPGSDANLEEKQAADNSGEKDHTKDHIAVVDAQESAGNDSAEGQIEIAVDGKGSWRCN